MLTTLISAKLLELSLVLAVLSSTLTAQNVIVINGSNSPQVEREVEKYIVIGKGMENSYLGQNFDKNNEIIGLIDKISKDYEISDDLRDLAVNLAWLESRFDPFARSSRSTAKGIFQWLDGSWAALCPGGDVWKAEDNIRCAIRTIKFGGLRHWTIDPQICSGLVNKGHIKRSECAYKELSLK